MLFKNNNFPFFLFPLFSRFSRSLSCLFILFLLQHSHAVPYNNTMGAKIIQNKNIKNIDTTDYLLYGLSSLIVLFVMFRVAIWLIIFIHEVINRLDNGTVAVHSVGPFISEEVRHPPEEGDQAALVLAVVGH